METIPSNILRCIIGLLLCVSLVAGCSGIKPYPNTLNKNVNVLTKAESGSFFSKVRAAVDIYSVDAKCQTVYEGTVQLKKASIPVGLPSDKASYLVFSFNSSSFLANSSSSISYDTLLKPRAGYSYEIKVTYKDDIYNVVIRESHPKKSARDIDRKDFSSCKPS